MFLEFVQINYYENNWICGIAFTKNMQSPKYPNYFPRPSNLPPNKQKGECKLQIALYDTQDIKFKEIKAQRG